MARTKVDGNPFLDPAAPSLATVLEALETAEPNARRRGEMASGIGRSVGCLGTALTNCRPTRRCLAG